MNENDTQISREAARWVNRNANKQFLIEKFVSIQKYPPVEHPLVFFMAGSPGAGKTEFVREFAPIARPTNLLPSPFAVIDPDAIRNLLPGYSGGNAHLFQSAISIGVDILYRHTLKNNQNMIVDGTFANYDRAKRNIEQAITNRGMCAILYVFQHPAIAWNFTQKREAVEGRRITKNAFVDKFIAAKETVETIKSEFGDLVRLYVIIKDYKDVQDNRRIAEVYTDVQQIEPYTKFRYTQDEIKRLIE